MGINKLAAITNNICAKMTEKVKYVVKEICKTNEDFPCVEIIENSEFYVITRTKQHTWDPQECYIEFKVVPEIYIKHVNDIDRITGMIRNYFEISTTRNDLIILNLEVNLDYTKVSILNSEVSFIQTEWGEINELQKQIIENMRKAVNSMDFQNIGNTSRTIMEKLARLVFDSKTHTTTAKVDLSKGKFKNQLHTYINCLLNGEQNKELRQFSESAITFMEKSIDLMNQTTHKLDVQKHFAEVCVISTISVISLIKAVSEV